MPFKRRDQRLGVWCLTGMMVIFWCVLPSVSHAKLDLPPAGQMVNLSPAYVPVIMKGLTVHPENPLLFDFILDPGNSGLKHDNPALTATSTTLIKYFLAGLTLKEDDLWVNLSPYEHNRIVPTALGKTEMGRDMLAQDYLLKQITASLMHPEKELGKEFWNRIYEKSQQRFGNLAIPVNTFNKVWITPDVAEVYVHNNTVYITKSHLKVMLEEDYLATTIASPTVRNNSTQQLIREIILPAIEQEVNQGKNFAQLRQIYHALILAAWFKTTLKDSVLTQAFANKNKTSGIISDDPMINAKIYQQYVEAYKKGVFNFIKDDVDRLSKEPIARKYFSGGETFMGTSGKIIQRETPLGQRDLSAANNLLRLRIAANPVNDNSMLTAPLRTSDGLSFSEVIPLYYAALLKDPTTNPLEWTPQNPKLVMHNGYDLSIAEFQRMDDLLLATNLRKIVEESKKFNEAKVGNEFFSDDMLTQKQTPVSRQDLIDCVNSIMLDATTYFGSIFKIYDKASAEEPKAMRTQAMVENSLIKIDRMDYIRRYIALMAVIAQRWDASAPIEVDDSPLNQGIIEQTVYDTQQDTIASLLRHNPIPVIEAVLQLVHKSMSDIKELKIKYGGSAKIHTLSVEQLKGKIASKAEFFLNIGVEIFFNDGSSVTVKRLLRDRITTITQQVSGPPAFADSLVALFEPPPIDIAMAVNGGIDLNVNKINVKQTGGAITFTMDEAMRVRLTQGNFDGLSPVVLNITAITDLPQLLGVLP